MTPAEILALAAQGMKIVNGLMNAAEVAQGAPLTDEQREAIIEGKELKEHEWAELAPD